MALVVDTDVFSYFLKNDTCADLYRPHLRGHFLFLSFMTVAEVEQWAIRSSWGEQRRNDLEKNLRRFMIQHSTRRICRLWAKVKDEGRSSGINVSANDAFVAATSLYFNIPLVTHNANDFRFVNGLIVISES